MPRHPSDPLQGWRAGLHRFARSPRTKLATALFLLVTSVANLVEGAFFDLGEALDPAHALLVLGVLMMAQSLGELLEAVEKFDEAEDDG